LALVRQDAFEDIRSRLATIAEELADMGLARLKEAVGTGSHEAVLAERRLTRARRSVLKAVALLGADPGADDEMG
jgi:hypothetical protein